MTRIVEIRTGARLHFGLFTTDSEGGPFGGIGTQVARRPERWLSTTDRCHRDHDREHAQALPGASGRAPSSDETIAARQLLLAERGVGVPADLLTEDTSAP